MPTVSIITAAHAPSAKYLTETINGVDRQELPEGWDLEWVVQEDGETPCLADRFTHLPYVRYEANEAQYGIATTRNNALSRATGHLIQVLDSDDVLLPGALTSLIPLFDDPKIHWAAGQADDLLPDGTRVPWPSALKYGVIPAGMVNAWAEGHGGNWPIHCAGLMLRATPVRALGGWVGLPVDEDIAMFAALCEISDGYNYGQVTWLYRQHAGQTTRSQGKKNPSLESRRFALQRAKAMRLTGLRFDERGRPTHPAHDVEVGPAVKKHSLDE